MGPHKCSSRLFGLAVVETGRRAAGLTKLRIVLESMEGPRLRMLLRPLYGLIRAHVFAGARVHGDDTTVPVLGEGKPVTGRVCVRVDRPFGGTGPPAALFPYRATPLSPL